MAVLAAFPPPPYPRLKLSRPTNTRLNAGLSFIFSLSLLVRFLFWADCNDDDKERTLYLFHATFYATFYSSQSLSLLYLNGMVGRFSIFSLSAATVVMSLPQKRKKVVWFRT